MKLRLYLFIMMHRDIYASGLWCTVCDSFFEEDASTFSTLLAMQFFCWETRCNIGVQFFLPLGVALQEQLFHVTWP